MAEFIIEAIQVLAKSQKRWREADPSDYSKKKTRFLSMYDMLCDALKNHDKLH